MRINVIFSLSIAAFLVLAGASCTGSQGGDPSDGRTGPDSGRTDPNSSSGTPDGSTGPGQGSDETVSIGDMNRGLRVWLAADCRQCHTIGDDPGGDVGPSLTGVGDRYTKEELIQLITDPASINPNATMPPHELASEDLEYLARYLSILSSDTAQYEE